MATDLLQAPPLLQPTAQPVAQTGLLEAAPLERPHVAQSTYDALVAGFQDSATGLAVRGKLPDTELGEHAPWWQRLTFGVTGAVSDLPESIIGFLVGAVAGSELPGVGTAVAGGAASFAVPMGMRDALIAAYQQPGGPRTWPEVWDIIKAGAIGAVKGAVIGGATGGAGHLAKAGTKAVEPALERTLGHIGAEATKFAGEAGAEVGTLGTTSALVQGRAPGEADYEGALLFKTGERFSGVIPRWFDFQDAAIAVGGYHAAKDVAGRIMNVFRKTGIPPDQVAADAARDPAIRESLKTSDDLPDAYKPLAEAEAARSAVPEPSDAARQFVEQPFDEIPQAPGAKTLPTHINYDYINSTDDAAAALARLSHLYLDDIQTQRRGEVSWAQTDMEARKLLAKSLGVTPDRIPLDRTPGSPVSTAELRARHQMAVAAAEDLVQKARAVSEAGQDATTQQLTDYLAAVDRAAMIHSQFLGARAEAGRMLNVLKNSSRLAVQLDQLHSVVKSDGGIDEVLNAANAISKADSPAAALDAAATMRKPTLLEKGIEVWKASILSGLGTSEANITGNMIGTASHIVERGIASGIGKLHGGDRVETAEPLALLNGMAHGAIDAIRMGANAFMGRSRVEVVTRAARQQALSENLREGTPEFTARMQELFENPTQAMLDAAESVRPGKLEENRGAIGTSPDSTPFAKAAGYVIRTPFRFVKAQDVFFRQFNESGEAFALATRKAIQEGYHPGTSEFSARVSDIARHPDEEMEAAIKAAGDRSVFASKLGPRMEAFEQAVRGSPLEFIIPFRNIVVNLEKWAVERTPGVNLLLPSVRADFAAGGARRDMAIARTIAGAAIIGTAWAALKSGTLTGGGLTQPEQRATKRAAGWQPYSIKLDGKYYSYARLDPLARILSFVADMGEISQAVEQNGENAAKIPTMTALAVGSALVNQTYMQAISETMNALTDPQRYSMRWLEGYARSLVPNLIGQTARQLDPETRQVNSLLEAMESQIPGLREQLLPVRNPLTGQPEPSRRSTVPFGPITVTNEATDPVVAEAARLGVHLAPAPRTVHVLPGSGNAGDIKLTPEQRDAFTQAQGEFFHHIMAPIVNSPGWANLPDSLKTELYTNSIEIARAQGRMAALPPTQRIKATQDVATQLEQSLTR